MPDNQSPWGSRFEDLPVIGTNWGREITPQEKEYIKLLYAYVQILNPKAMGEFSEISFVRAESGWLIFNYKNAMAASPGEFLYGNEVYLMLEDGSFQRACSGTGSRPKQIIDTASTMVGLARDQSWSEIYVVNGHPLMTWGIWMAATNLNIPVSGYAPTKAEEQKYERIKNTCPALQEQLTATAQGPVK